MPGNAVQLAPDYQMHQLTLSINQIYQAVH
jgi:hypothetical protein